MTSSIKIRSKRANNKTELRLLISHPMEFGATQDPQTNVMIPAQFIHTLTIHLNGQIVISCKLGMSISKDPFFAFMLNTGQAGDKVVVSWEDNLGNTDSSEHVLA